MEVRQEYHVFYGPFYGEQVFDLSEKKHLFAFVQESSNHYLNLCLHFINERNSKNTLKVTQTFIQA